MDRRETASPPAPPAGELPSSCDVSDACDVLGIDAARTGLLRPLWPACPRLAGLLTTVRLEAAAASATPLPQLLEVMAQAEGGLLLVDLAGRTDVQCWGSVLATAARRYGIEGALVNGAARDVDDLCELGFPTYGRGVYPGRILGRLRLAAVDEPVDLDGTRVDPRSFAVADSSGAVFVPQARVEEVLALAAERLATEREQLQAVMAGADPRAISGGSVGKLVPGQSG